MSYNILNVSKHIEVSVRTIILTSHWLLHSLPGFTVNTVEGVTTRRVINRESNQVIYISGEV